jgi:hypothetical protein
MSKQHQEYLSQPHIIAELTRNIILVRPKKGKASIYHMAAATTHVHAALEKYGWDKWRDVVKSLIAKGYSVEVRDYKKGDSSD